MEAIAGTLFRPPSRFTTNMSASGKKIPARKIVSEIRSSFSHRPNLLARSDATLSPPSDAARHSQCSCPIMLHRRTPKLVNRLIRQRTKGAALALRALNPVRNNRNKHERPTIQSVTARSVRSPGTRLSRPPNGVRREHRMENLLGRDRPRFMMNGLFPGACFLRRRHQSLPARLA